MCSQDEIVVPGMLTQNNNTFFFFFFFFNNYTILGEKYISHNWHLCLWQTPAGLGGYYNFHAVGVSM